MKLLLNEALDLRYSQEIQLEHERSPGFFVPVIDCEYCVALDTDSDTIVKSQSFT